MGGVGAAGAGAGTDAEWLRRSGTCSQASRASRGNLSSVARYASLMHPGPTAILAIALGPALVGGAAPVSPAPAATTAMSTTTFFKGSGSSTVLFNAKGGTFYDGPGTGTVLLNLSGSKAFKGAGSGSVLYNVSGSKVFRGSGSSDCLWNISGGKVYEGAGSSKVLYNVSGTRLYRGAGSSDVACNWSGGSVGTNELAAVVWLVEGE